MTFLDRLYSPKCDFTQNQSGGKVIKFQQSQALTSHYESFWSIVTEMFIFSGLGSEVALLCSSCNESFLHPWDLLVHVQKAHSLQIYEESADGELLTSVVGVGINVDGSDVMPGGGVGGPPPGVLLEPGAKSV